MSYFTAVIAADGRGWRTRDVDVEDAGSLDDLADTLRGIRRGQHPVLAVIEHEDEWFALVRVDGDDDPRVFVSDLAAASRGVFGELLAPAGEVDSVGGARPASGVLDLDEEPEDDDVEEDDVDVPADALGAEAGDLEEEVDLSDLETDDPEPPPPWAGHADLLADLGVDAELVVKLCDEHSDDPATVLAEIGETAGFAELLEALR